MNPLNGLLSRNIGGKFMKLLRSTQNLMQLQEVNWRTDAEGAFVY